MYRLQRYMALVIIDEESIESAEFQRYLLNRFKIQMRSLATYASS